MSNQPAELAAVAARALEMVPQGAVLGLGTGHAATAFIQALGPALRRGLRVRGVPTSQASAELARSLGIPLVSIDDVDALDLDVDGADEVDPNLNLIKGYGGALVREKIVAAAARKLVILVGPEKLVEQLGQHGKLPVEVLQFGFKRCQRVLATLGLPSEVRQADGRPFVTDNGNYILDAKITSIADPVALEQQLLAVPGVVGTGLFIGMRPTVIVARESGVEVLEGSQSA